MINWQPYIGIKFQDHGSDAAGCDCYGLCRMALAAEYGWVLPSYGADYDKASNQRAVTEVIKAGLVEGWDRVEEAVEGALVIFRMAGKPWHVGLVVSPTQFLHVAPGETSGVERLDSPSWACRVEGFYTRRGIPA